MEAETPEAVAYRLMDDILRAEGETRTKAATRKEVLDLYAECLRATRGARRLD